MSHGDEIARTSTLSMENIVKQDTIVYHPNIGRLMTNNSSSVDSVNGPGEEELNILG